MLAERKKTKRPIEVLFLLTSIVSLAIVIVAYRQISSSQNRLENNLLIKTIYETEACPRPPCRPRASLRSREEAVKTYVNNQRNYGRRAVLKHADLGQMNLAGMDLSHADLSGATLEAVNLREAKLLGTQLEEADLSHALLVEADLSGANLSFALLRSANLERALLVRSVLKGAVLGECTTGFDTATGESYQAAILTYARLDGADFTNSLVCGVDFRGASLAGAIGLTQGQLDSVIGDSSTILPPYLPRPARWISKKGRGDAESN